MLFSQKKILFFSVTGQPGHDLICGNRAYDGAIVDDTNRARMLRKRIENVDQRR